MSWKKKGPKYSKKNATSTSNPSQYAILVGNYPQSIGPDAIIQAISMQTFSMVKYQVTPMKGTIFPNNEFSIFYSNETQVNAVLNINGSYIYNNPIWIIKYPFIYQSYRQPIINLISSFVSDGLGDFSNLAQRSVSFGNNTNFINFNDQNFAEYFFYMLGSESRDKRIFIESIILNSNSIIDLNIIIKYFVFLPTLRTVYANQNPLKYEPKPHPRIIIYYDPIGKNKADDSKPFDPNDPWTRIVWVDLRAQDQTSWNIYQRSNGWNQFQNNNQTSINPLPLPIPQQTGFDQNNFSNFNDTSFNQDFSSGSGFGDTFGGQDFSSGSGFGETFGSQDLSAGSGFGDTFSGGRSSSFAPDTSSAPHPEVSVRSEPSDLSKEDLARLCSANVIQ